MAEATAPRFLKTTVSHVDFINSSIQKRINGIARAIENRFRKRIKVLEEENDALKKKQILLEGFNKNHSIYQIPAQVKPAVTYNPTITEKQRSYGRTTRPGT